MSSSVRVLGARSRRITHSVRIVRPKCRRRRVPRSSPKPRSFRLGFEHSENLKFRRVLSFLCRRQYYLLEKSLVEKSSDYASNRIRTEQGPFDGGRTKDSSSRFTRGDRDLKTEKRGLRRAVRNGVRGCGLIFTSIDSRSRCFLSVRS